jgi:hypothetical protein
MEKQTYFTGNDGRACVRQLTIDDVQIGSTDAAGIDFYDQLLRPWMWVAHA